MWRAEVGLLFRRVRTRALLLVLVLVPAAIAIAIRISGGPTTGQGPRFLDQVTHNGVSVALFCFVATLAVAVAGLIVGAILFPIGPVTTLSGDTLSLGAGTLRIFAASLLVGTSLLGLAAVGLFISTLTDAPVGAMAGTVGVAVLSGVLNAVPPLSWMHPWLITHYWLSFGDVLRSPVYWTDILFNLGLQAVYVVIFSAAAWARFTNKDVLA